MGLLSFFKRQDESSGEAGTPDAVVQARTRARRRLIGATVLLGVGVLGFPLVFETQPRPIPVDIPIEIPRKESAPPLALPPMQPAVPAPAAPAPRALPAQVVASQAASSVVTERATEQGREVPPPTPAASVAAAPASVNRPATAASAAKPAAAAAASAPRAAAPAADDGRRAQALLEGKPVAPKASDASIGRIVVQVGAYTDADKLREARQKVEKLGMKTYTQVVESDAGKRTRVRVGPFATREEADKAAARIRAAGLPTAILAL
ncbi:MAG: SPOR domain-containing protein [Burkholderiales bacterium]|nr:SPOR domain-containing protein [Burkholderiales bacterium]